MGTHKVASPFRWVQTVQLHRFAPDFSPIGCICTAGQLHCASPGEIALRHRVAERLEIPRPLRRDALRSMSLPRPRVRSRPRPMERFETKNESFRLICTGFMFHRKENSGSGPFISRPARRMRSSDFGELSRAAFICGSTLSQNPKPFKTIPLYYHARRQLFDRISRAAATSYECALALRL